jgi:membrane-bound lytic murein transglycosylase B
MKLKPRLVLDIRSNGDDVFAYRRKLVNLSTVKRTIPVRRFRFIAVIVLFLPFLLFGSAVAPISTGTTVSTGNSANDAKRQELERQLQQLESQIADYENMIANYQKQGNTLKNEINSLDAKIAKINLQIRAIDLSLKELDSEIQATSAKINDTVSNIEANKISLAGALQNLYESDKQSMVEVLLSHPQISDFFGSVNNLMALQQNVQVAIAKLSALESDLQGQKEELGTQRADTAALKKFQDSQRQILQSTKNDKNTLLMQTKGKESEYKKILTDTKKTAAQIRNQIFELLGGGELTFDKAYALAKSAQDATGVRAAFILAVLDRESALGQNVGQCSYNQVMPGGTTAMSPKEMPIFLSILRSLAINPDTVKVSCPNQDGVYGGAMGPAQFLPSTWNLYSPKVAEIVGHNPNPWNNADAFIAAALYLKDAGAASSEKQAAARYYCGSSWTRYVCLNVYGYNVIQQASRFQQDIDILNAG